MKRIFQKLLLWISCIALAVSMVSCEEDNGGKNNSEENNDELYQSVLNTYVSSTIVPTYKNLAEAALEMRTANEALKITPNDANMQAASDAWMKARICWELSEAFLFGPVGDQALDIDGHIDSWPLELEDIKSVLADGALGLTGRKAWIMDPEVIGFHVTEYLLYRDGQSRKAADLDEAQLNYLTAATDALVWDCVLAYVAWVGENNVTETMKAVLNENPDVVAHLNNNPAYMEFGKRLTTKTGYPSWAAAVGEIAVGAGEIAGEVGATKIQSPYVNNKVEDVESWYSWHSLDDYKNNIYSIKNAYLGGMDDNSRTSVSLSTFVALKNSELDTQIKAKIEECLTKITAIGKDGKSFYEVVRDRTNKTEVDAAVKACLELQTMFDTLPDILI